MNNRLFSITFLSLIITTSICALAKESDSVLFVSEDELDTYWIVDKVVAPEYPEKSLRRLEEGCVAVGFIIESDGTTSTHKIVAFYPTNHFNRSAIRAAKKFLFKPSEKNAGKQTVLTTNSFTYQIRQGKEFDEQKQATLKKVCMDAADKSLNSDSSKAGTG
jgi:TonB family protein